MTKIPSENSLSEKLESIKKPNFFFVGHTRSGTTSLKEELEQHPEIYFYYPKSWKKPNGPFGFESSFKNEEEFLEEFRGVNEKRIGQKRGDYLSCPWAAEGIKKFSPDAKIIMTLRNPINVMYSLHATMLYRETVENIEDFGKALEIEEERKKKYGYKIIPKKYHPHMLYRETVRYPQQVRRYFELFGEENVKVTIFEEYIRTDVDNLEPFKSNPKGEFTIVISKKVKEKNSSIILKESDKKNIQKMIRKLSIKDITDLISQNSKVSKKEIYNYCLTLKNEK